MSTEFIVGICLPTTQIQWPLECSNFSDTGLMRYSKRQVKHKTRVPIITVGGTAKRQPATTPFVSPLFKNLDPRMPYKN